ncbi:hypothetical protein [Brevibacterium moorei]|uniref:hypothetical protein n=1 Tax=Brevibacterium moorei TaxID=2968457 RepID=UPI00211BD3E5|nr:hypothetical protein [Brevibacterium sp. 68QC2CO]MCQ9385871.1 hypothetical protein [Brevibacterium sp. 68QC2CO]
MSSDPAGPQEPSDPQDPASLPDPDEPGLSRAERIRRLELRKKATAATRTPAQVHAGKQAKRAADARVRRRLPGTARLALTGLLLEAAEMIVFAIALIVLELATGAQNLASTLALAMIFIILGAGIAAMARAFSRCARWARPASTAWQVLLVLTGFSGVLGNLAAGLIVIVPAALVLVGTFLPATLRYYEAELARQDEAAQRG